MGKLWARWERNGNASVVRAIAMAVVAIGTIVLLVAVSPGGLNLFDSLKGY